MNNMKLAWICFERDEDYLLGYNPDAGQIFLCEPPYWKYAKIIQIVWAELVK